MDTQRKKRPRIQTLVHEDPQETQDNIQSPRTNEDTSSVPHGPSGPQPDPWSRQGPTGCCPGPRNPGGTPLMLHKDMLHLQQPWHLWDNPPPLPPGPTLRDPNTSTKDKVTRYGATDIRYRSETSALMGGARLAAQPSPKSNKTKTNKKNDQRPKMTPKAPRDEGNP